MMIDSFADLAEMDMVHFEDFSHLLALDMTEKKMLELGYRHRAPGAFRVGHGKPRWSKEAIAFWIRNEVQRRPQDGRGRRRIKRVADDLS